MTTLSISANQSKQLLSYSLKRKLLTYKPSLQTKELLVWGVAMGILFIGTEIGLGILLMNSH